jgi:hypothetical protein
MAGLVPAIHVLSRCRAKGVDARVKPGHDGDHWAIALIPLATADTVPRA